MHENKYFIFSKKNPEDGTILLLRLVIENFAMHWSPSIISGLQPYQAH